jgi:hypothetical protein
MTGYDCREIGKLEISSGAVVFPFKGAIGLDHTPKSRNRESRELKKTSNSKQSDAPARERKPNEDEMADRLPDFF